MLNIEFLLAALQIIAIDILLSGDNAVVIALACRKLPKAVQNKAIFLGVLGAIGLRVALIFFALQLLALPYLKIAGAMMLSYIAIQLIQDESDDEHHVAGKTTLFGAFQTILVADLTMSLDNVIAVAGAANGNIGLVVFGLLFSIPIIIYGSKLVMALMERFSFIVTLGAAMLGWIAGGMFADDPFIKSMFSNQGPSIALVLSAVGACTVLAVAKMQTVFAGRWNKFKEP